MDLKLSYIGKQKEQDILNCIPKTSFDKPKTLGQSRLDNWQNMLISGDNLPALATLMQDPKVAGQVKLVYIDPPFSTNQEFKRGSSRTATISRSDEDQSAYLDKVLGAEYIDFLRKRLVLLKHILANDGSIYVHIDWKMGHYVKVLMDEVFGYKHFISDITRIKCNPKNFERRGYGNIKDMILFYSKTDKYIWHEPKEKLTQEDIERLFPKIDEDGRRYTTTPLHAPGETHNGPTGRPWKKLKPPRGRHWRCPPEQLTILDEQGLIEWSSTGNPRKKIYADEILANGKKRQDIWEFKDPQYPSYPTEKNLDMLKVIIQASSNPDDLILDCFAGAGTTLVAAESLERRWIGIDNSDVAIETACERLSQIENLSAFTVYKTKPHKVKKGDGHESMD